MNTRSVTATNLLDRLREVRSLEFEARSTLPTGWNGAGLGAVEVATLSSDVVLFTETGFWKPAGATQEIRFNNVFRWSRTETAVVRLDHLRFGPEHPVHLFELIPGDGGWLSRSPHVCVDDLYSARLDIGDSVVSLQWTILGPRKNETIRYRYGNGGDTTVT